MHKNNPNIHKDVWATASCKFRILNKTNQNFFFCVCEVYRDALILNNVKDLVSLLFLHIICRTKRGKDLITFCFGECDNIHGLTAVLLFEKIEFELFHIFCFAFAKIQLFCESASDFQKKYPPLSFLFL